MSSNNWIKLKKQYEEREIEPSSDLWNKIDNQLNSKSETEIRAGFSSNWMKYAAAIIALIAFGYILKIALDTNQISDKTEKLSKKEDVQTKNNAEDQILGTVNKEVDEYVAGKDSHQYFSAEKSKSIRETSNKSSMSFHNRTDFRPDIEKPTFTDAGQGNAALPLEKPANRMIDNLQNSTENQKPQKIAQIDAFPERIVEKPVTKSYVTADELLFSRELNSKKKKNKSESAHFGNLDFTLLKKTRPTSFKILGIELMDGDSTKF